MKVAGKKGKKSRPLYIVLSTSPDVKQQASSSQSVYLGWISALRNVDRRFFLGNDASDMVVVWVKHKH